MTAKSAVQHDASHARRRPGLSLLGSSGDGVNCYAPGVKRPQRSVADGTDRGHPRSLERPKDGGPTV